MFTQFFFFFVGQSAFWFQLISVLYPCRYWFFCCLSW